MPQTTISNHKFDKILFHFIVMICSTFKALKAGAGESVETSKSKINILKVSDLTNPSPSLLGSLQSHFSKTQEGALPDYTDCSVVLAGQQWRVCYQLVCYDPKALFTFFGLINTKCKSHHECTSVWKGSPALQLLLTTHGVSIALTAAHSLVQGQCALC